MLFRGVWSFDGELPSRSMRKQQAAQIAGKEESLHAGASKNPLFVVLVVWELFLDNHFF